MNKIDAIHIGQAKVLSTWLQKELFSRIGKNVWSDEQLSGLVLNWRSGAVTRNIMLYGLKALYPDAKILVCVRNDERAWVSSIYSQYVKQGGFKSFEQWFQQDFDKRFIDQKQYIDEIKKLFDDVYVFCFEDFLDDKEKVVGELCDWLGVPVPIGLDVDKQYNKKFVGFRMGVARLRGIFFKVSRILLEVDKFA